MAKTTKMKKVEEKATERVLMSVVDVEKKYVYDPSEDVYGGGDGIVSWGVANDLPKLLINCSERSATLKACIDQSINYVMGDDIIVNDEAAKWREKVNRRGLDMRGLINRILSDYFTTGNFAIQIIYNGLGQPVELFPLDVAKCRLNKNRDQVIYNKKGFSRWSTAGERYDRWGYADFDPEKGTMIYFYNGDGVRKVYNTAPWAAALDDVLTEIEGSRFSLNSVANGFSARYIIEIPDTSNLTDEQKDIVVQGIRDHFTGSDAPSNFMVYWGNDESKSLEVRKIEADETPERFNAIRQAAKENIFTAMRMSPLLVGTAVANTGFSTEEYMSAYKLYNRTIAMGYQDMIKAVIDDITGVEGAITIIPFSIKF